MTTTISSTNAALLPDAIADMAEALSHAFADMGSSLNCTEVDRIARVLALAGHESEAGQVLVGHAAGDDDSDSHHALVDDEGATVHAERVKLYVSEDLLGHDSHQHLPDDSPGDDDLCKTCGRYLTWTGPSHLDWALVDY